jgi:hypothetical protein
MPTAVTKRPAWIFCSITLFAIVFGSIFLDRYNSFETSPRRAVIVDKFVSRRDTMVAASSSVVDPLHEWIPDRFSLPGAGGYLQVRSGGGRSRTRDYHANAVFEYTVISGDGSQETRQCTMTMHYYSTEEHAEHGLHSIPIGKEKDVHVSKQHGGKYCASSSKLQSYLEGGVAVICAAGVMWILAGAYVVYRHFHSKSAPVRLTLTEENLEVHSAGRRPPPALTRDGLRADTTEATPPTRSIYEYRAASQAHSRRVHDSSVAQHPSVLPAVIYGRVSDVEMAALDTGCEPLSEARPVAAVIRPSSAGHPYGAVPALPVLTAVPVGRDKHVSSRTQR